jgi:hypothetical protein
MSGFIVKESVKQNKYIPALNESSLFSGRDKQRKNAERENISGAR